MNSYQSPALLLSSDVVWIEGDAAAPASNEPITIASIGELSAKFGVTPRALRFYETKGLLSPRRDGRNRIYSRSDCERLSLILKGKKLGFTLVEIGEMIEAQEGRATAQSLKLSREKCLEQINLLERQVADLQEALAELRRMHTMLAGTAASEVR